MFNLTLKLWRKKAGYKSQAEAAKALGMKERRYASLEREEVALTLEEAYTISVALGCTPNDLCDWYATHPRERPQPRERDPEHAMLVEAYDACTPARRRSVMQQARDAAFASKEFAERADDVAQGA